MRSFSFSRRGGGVDVTALRPCPFDQLSPARKRDWSLFNMGYPAVIEHGGIHSSRAGGEGVYGQGLTLTEEEAARHFVGFRSLTDSVRLVVDRKSQAAFRHAGFRCPRPSWMSTYSSRRCAVANYYLYGQEGLILWLLQTASTTLKSSSILPHGCQ